MKKIGLLALGLALILTLVFSASALGDDVDFGGDTGGGDWGDWGDTGGDWGDDDDWGDTAGGGNNTGGGYTGGGGIGFPVGGYYGGGSDMGIASFGGGTIMVIIIIAIIFYMMSQKGGKARPAGMSRRIDSASLQALMQKDPKFSGADMEAKVKNWVLQFETAWAGGDMTSCRPFLSDGLYNTYQMQLDMMRKNGEASRTEDLAVMACSVERWTFDADKEYLDVWLQEKKKTYKVDINNPQNVIKGDRQTTYVLEYRWQLMRSAGSLTESSGLRVMECPNCGAETSVNQSGKCEYCGSTIKAESFDWTLNKVDKLSQSSHK